MPVENLLGEFSNVSSSLLFLPRGSSVLLLLGGKFFSVLQNILRRVAFAFTLRVTHNCYFLVDAEATAIAQEWRTDLVRKSVALG